MVQCFHIWLDVIGGYQHVEQQHMHEVPIVRLALAHPTWQRNMSVTLLTRLCPLLCAVYGRENRLKVARDEAQHAAEEAEALEKHLKAEAEHRHRLLLQRARQRRNTDHQQQPALEAADNQDHEQEDSLEHAPLLTVEERPSTNSPPAATAVASTTEKAEDTPGHINFWADLEAKAAHPDKEVSSSHNLVNTHACCMPLLAT